MSALLVHESSLFDALLIPDAYRIVEVPVIADLDSMA